MKRIRKSRAARILSWLLTVAMITPLISGMMTPRPAAAQQPVASSGSQTVIVIDFVNKSGFGGDALARFATDAIHVELATSGRFEVLPREQVMRAARDLDLRPPFDTIALTKIAAQLNANAIVTGEIAAVKIDTKASPKSVSVGLSVRVLDAANGDPINGAAEVGDYPARPGETDNDALAQGAVRNAAAKCTQTILAYNLPEGIVLYTVGDAQSQTVVINRGLRDGIKEGMELIVIRDKQRVGKIRISDVYPTDAEGKVVQSTLGLRPEDRVRAVFAVPDLKSLTMAEKEHRNPGGRRPSSMGVLGKVLIVLLVGVVIVSAASGRQQTVTGVVAEPEIKSNTPAVKVVWRDNLFGAGQDLEYHVWRTPDAPYGLTSYPVATADPSFTQYDDMASTTGFWDGIRSFLRPSITSGTSNGSGAGDATSVTPAAGAVPGPKLGTTYIYSVSSVIRRVYVPNGTNNNSGGTTNTTEDIESTPVVSGSATPLAQSQLSNPADQTLNVDITSTSFTWLSVTGADVFQLEITTQSNRNFSNKNLVVRVPFISTAPYSTGVSQSLSAPLNLATNSTLLKDATFAAWVHGSTSATQPTLYWRVGARNSYDKPGPVNALSGNPHDGDTTYRYIYSNARTFTAAVLPPNPP